MRKLLPAIIVALAAIALVWFFSARRSDQASPLAFVPAQTPYVFANVEPMPTRVVEQLRGQLRAIGPMYRPLLDELVGELRERHPGAADPAAAIFELLEREFAGMSADEVLDAVGIGLGGRFVLFGHGATPVLRAELESPERFNSLLGRLEQAAGTPLARGTIDGTEYVVLGDRDAAVTGMMALIGDELVLTALPRGAEDALVRELLGLVLPEQSLAASGELRELMRRFDYLPQAVGYVDTVRLVQAFVGTPGRADQAMRAALDVPATTLDEVCRDELLTLAAAWPRASTGYTRLDDRRYESRSVIEARVDIAESLLELRAPMPGLQASDEATLAELGLSLRLTALPAVLNRHADAVRAAPWRCDMLAPLNQGFASAREQLSNPGMFLVAPLAHAVYLNLSHVDTGGAQGGEPDARGVLVIGSDNPSALVGMAQSVLPALGRLGLQPDSAPHPLPLSDFGLSQTASVAMGASAIGLSVGPGEEARLGRALGSDPSRQPVLVYGTSSSLYALFDELGSRLTGPAGPVQAPDKGKVPGPVTGPTPPATATTLPGFGDIYPHLFRYLRLEVDFTKDGIEVRQSIDLP